MEERVTFEAGAIQLEGLISIPDGEVATGVVLCHPHPLYGGEMRNNVVTYLTDAYRDAGFATLRFNFRGVGQSGGSHDDGVAEKTDVSAAIGYLHEHCQPQRLVLTGYSFGAMVGLPAGAEDDRVDALIGVGTPVQRIDSSELAGAGKPILLVSGDQDHVSPRVGLESLFADLAEPKQLVLIEGSDHFMVGREREAADAALTFLGSLES